jgi:cytoskeletal protein CcmA (bactofilin family)
MQPATHRRGQRVAVLSVLILALLLGGAGAALAAEMASGDAYRLESGKTVSDDLYVTGEEIHIDGRVEGDLIAFAGIVEVKGEVTGDVIAAGGEVVIDGTVGDDARVAGAGIRINGKIGDDLLAAGGGSGPGMPPFPMQVGNRQVQQGVWVSSDATVGGDAYIVGGAGAIDGQIVGDLFVGMSSVVFSGDVGGDARLYGNRVVVSPEATVAGTLTYMTEQPLTVPEGVAATVQQETAPVAPKPPEPTLTQRLLDWGIRFGRALLGLFILGWLLLKLAPTFMENTRAAMRGRAWAALGIGFIVFLVAVPIIVFLVAAAWLFWGFFPGAVATALLLIGILGVLWFTSPALAGLCLGSTLLKNSTSRLLQLFVGTLIVLLLAQAAEWIPNVGWLVAWLVLVVSFMFAAGAIILGLHTPPAAPAAPQPVPRAEESASTESP